MAPNDTTASTLILFELDGFRFALDALKVQRLVRAGEITPLPGLPAGVLGVVSVAGEVVPVFDLRGRLRMPPRAVRSSDHFIIVRCDARLVALVVDNVTDVVPAAEAGFISASEVLPGLASVEGWVKVNGELIMIYDLGKFLSMDELLSLEKAMRT